MTTIYEKSKGLQDTELHYCPGCSHGIVHKLIAEILEEMDAVGTAIGICPVGCAVFAGNYFAFDTIEAAHGRAPAVATAVKRTHPTQPVFTYQGDGDLASIGAAEIVHAAMRGEKFTTIFINNAIYGMTGGQMAPTTLIGQRATTAPLGRTKEQAGMPMRVAELISTLDGCVYAERVCVTDIPHLNKAKKGKTFFTMGGGSSHDIDGGILEPDDPQFKRKCRKLDHRGALYRVNHRSWWKEELPSEEEYQTARASLDQHGWNVDYIITHCGPTSVQDELSKGFYKADTLTDFLDEVAGRCQFRNWFLGHYHVNAVIQKKFAVLYEQIICLKL